VEQFYCLHALANGNYIKYAIFIKILATERFPTAQVLSIGHPKLLASFNDYIWLPICAPQ